MAPDNRKELQDNLTLIADWRPPTPQEREALLQHGERVRRTRGPISVTDAPDHLVRWKGGNAPYAGLETSQKRIECC
jgi:hypothetical protein